VMLMICIPALSALHDGSGSPAPLEAACEGFLVTRRDEGQGVAGRVA